MLRQCLIVILHFEQTLYKLPFCADEISNVYAWKLKSKAAVL